MTTRCRELMYMLCRYNIMTWSDMDMLGLAKRRSDVLMPLARSLQVEARTFSSFSCRIYCDSLECGRRTI